jgi:hypothetical protein
MFVDTAYGVVIIYTIIKKYKTSYTLYLFIYKIGCATKNAPLCVCLHNCVVFFTLATFEYIRQLTNAGMVKVSLLIKQLMSVLVFHIYNALLLLPHVFHMY